MCPYLPSSQFSLDKTAQCAVFCPGGGIQASGTVMEAVAAVAVGAGVVPDKNSAYVVDSLLRETGQLVALLRVSSFILLVFYFSVPIFFPLTYLHLSRRQLQTYFLKKYLNQLWGGFIMNLSYIFKNPMKPNLK